MSGTNHGPHAWQQIPCPVKACGAKPGEYCRTTKGYEGITHQPRLNAAKFSDTCRPYEERFLNEAQAKQVVRLITELRLCPGANTVTDCLCLTDDPLGGGLEGPNGEVDCWFIGWDPHRGKWVAANQKLDKDGNTAWQAAYWWDPAEDREGGDWRHLPFIGW